MNFEIIFVFAVLALAVDLFVKVGTPLNIIFWLLATFLIRVFWKF